MAARVEAMKALSPEALGQKSRLTRFFHTNMYSATISVEAAQSLHGVKGWGIQEGPLGPAKLVHVDKEGRPDGKFFTVEGVNVANSKREVPTWGMFGIKELKDTSDPEGAVGTVMLLVDRKQDVTGKNVDRVLLQINAEPFAAEPGSDPEFFLQVRPSVQGSYTNLTDHRVTFSEQIKPEDLYPDNTNLVALNPGRIEGEVRMGVSFVEAEKIDISKNPNYQWFTIEEIDEAIRERLVPFNGAVLDALKIYDATHGPRTNITG